ncbi:hypothetical protein GCM10025792_47270 [Pseudonocardia tropica]
MATRHYLSNPVSSYLSSPFRGNWTSYWDSYMQVQGTTAFGSTLTGNTYQDEQDSVNPKSVFGLLAFTPPFTASGQVQGSLSGCVYATQRTEVTSNPCYLRLCLWLADGSRNFKSMIVAPQVLGAQLPATSDGFPLTGVGFSGVALTNAVANAGDLIVAEFGYSFSNSSNVGTVWRRGGAAQALSSGGQNGQPWMEFSGIDSLYSAAPAIESGRFFLSP